MTIRELDEYFNSCIKSNKIPHAIIVDGVSSDADKRPVYDFVYKLMGTLDHPDIIKLHHEKPNLISIDEIRQQVVDNIPIKPYASNHKVYIIEDAELMNPQSQNALLKSLEEPPAYSIIILMTKSAGILLETIRSRCVILSIGSGTYENNYGETARKIAQIAVKCIEANAQIAFTVSKEFEKLAKEEATYEQIFDIMHMLFRDALLISYNRQGLMLEDCIDISKELSAAGSAKLTKALDIIIETKRKISANVNKDLAIRQMILEMN